MSTTHNLNSKILYYVDYNGAVWRDLESGPYARLIRMIKSLWRDYDIFHVGAALEKAPASFEKDYVSSKIAKKCGITDSQYHSLTSMVKLFSKDAITTDQRVELVSFLEEIRGNKKFNTSMKTFMSKVKNLSTTSHKVFENLISFSHKTAIEDEFIRVSKKADQLLKNYINKTSIALDGDKLTLKDVKTLESSSKMKPFLDQIAQHQNLNGSSIHNLYEAVTTSHDFIEQTLALAEEQDPSKPGTFIVHDQKTLSAFRSTPIPSIFISFFRNILKTNIGHISIGFRDEHKHDMEAHIWGVPVGKVVISRRNLASRCFKTLLIHSERLVDGGQMKRLYGDDWEEILNSKYEKISQSYFKTNPEIKQLSNPSPRIGQVLAATGFRFSFSKQSWEERCEFPKNHLVICSEFAILASLQCLKKLNKEIKEEWNAFYPDEEAPKLNPPVRENRRLNRVIPHEIVQRAINEGLASEMPQAACILEMIQCNEEALIF